MENYLQEDKHQLVADYIMEDLEPTILFIRPTQTKLSITSQKQNRQQNMYILRY